MIPLVDSLNQVSAALYGERRFYQEDGSFTNNGFENIGGLGVFYALSNSPSRGLEYEFIGFENVHALPATKLPPSLLAFRERFSCIVRGTEPRTGGNNLGPLGFQARAPAIFPVHYGANGATSL
jgi:hypothetical protein